VVLRALAALVAAAGAACRASGPSAPGAPGEAARIVAGGAVALPPLPSVPLTNPVAGDGKSAAEGAAVFLAMNCDGCHGGGATGWAAPSLVDGRWRYGGGDAAVFQSIYYGRPHGMPAFGAAVSPAAIWKLVAYLRAQPVPADVPTESW